MNGGMIEQYMSIKNMYKNAILFFQVGGFFQLYYYDAEIVKEELGLTLRSRAVGNGQYAPMCGFPVSSEKKYCQSLTQNGYAVVVCVQTNEKEADGKCVRTVSYMEKPEEGIESKKISERWQEYLETYTFESIIEQQEDAKRRKKTLMNSHKAVSNLEYSAQENKFEETAKEELWECLAHVELNDTTPMMALLLLQDWKKRYVNGQRNTDRL